ncbi:MAG: choice-of-anchor Q domain-containing protein [Kiritimatiellae bacterium]|nr:choice-of-anchor Q domain-containing protein [Kiritimatiellia bacterium]
MRTWNVTHGGILTALALAATARAATYCVATAGSDANSGADWSKPLLTIGAAVAKCVSGDDTILVSNGVYTLSSTINLTSKNGVYIRSWNNGALDPTNTIVDGNDTVLGFLSWNSNPTLDGITVRNCRNIFSGGAISFWANGARVLNCLLLNNVSTNHTSDDAGGGGLYLGGTGTFASNCTLRGNSCSTNGGGAYVVNGARIVDSVVESNTACGAGGGLYVQNGPSFASNCIIRGNTAYGYGGGVRARHNATIYRCIVEGNTSYVNGGGVYLEDVSSLSRSTIKDNTAMGTGGGVFGGVISYTVGNCDLIGNQARGSGGGAYSVTLYNCTLSGNAAGTYGGGSYAYGGGAFYAKMYNCLVVGNKANQGGGLFSSFTAPGSELYNCTIVSNTAQYGGGCDMNGKGGIWNCIVYTNLQVGGDSPNLRGSSGLVTNSCMTPLVAGPGNIADDPKFVDAVGGNYRLRTDSPCIDKGLDGSWTTTYAFDLDGKPRLRNWQVDMGAFEALIPAGTVISCR